MVMDLVVDAVHCLRHDLLCSPQGCGFQYGTPLVVDVLAEAFVGTLVEIDMET